MEILFRAKRKDTGEWLFWNIYGEFCKENGKRTRVTVCKVSTILYYNNIHQIRHLIDENTVGRMMQIKDVIGKRVWEGDIIQDKQYDMKFVVKWDEGELRFAIEMDKCGPRGICRPFVCSCEKIGNIYDNPELASNFPIMQVLEE